MLAFKRALYLMCSVISLAAAAFILINTGLPHRAAYSGQPLPGEGFAAPELNAFALPFEQKTLNGSISLLEQRGNPVIINFWATWCEPCKIEMLELQTVYEANRQNGLKVLAINLGESEAVVRNWVNSLGLTFEVVLDPEQRIASLYRLRGQPSTYVVSPEGIITHIFYGPTTAESLQSAVMPYVTIEKPVYTR